MSSEHLVPLVPFQEARRLMARHNKKREIGKVLSKLKSDIWNYYTQSTDRLVNESYSKKTGVYESPNHELKQYFTTHQKHLQQYRSDSVTQYLLTPKTEWDFMLREEQVYQPHYYAQHVAYEYKESPANLFKRADFWIPLALPNGLLFVLENLQDDSPNPYKLIEELYTCYQVTDYRYRKVHFKKNYSDGFKYIFKEYDILNVFEDFLRNGEKHAVMSVSDSKKRHNLSALYPISDLDTTKYQRSYSYECKHYKLQIQTLRYSIPLTPDYDSPEVANQAAQTWFNTQIAEKLPPVCVEISVDYESHARHCIRILSHSPESAIVREFQGKLENPVTDMKFVDNKNTCHVAQVNHSDVAIAKYLGKKNRFAEEELMTMNLMQVPDIPPNSIEKTNTAVLFHRSGEWDLYMFGFNQEFYGLLIHYPSQHIPYLTNEEKQWWMDEAEGLHKRSFQGNNNQNKNFPKPPNPQVTRPPAETQRTPAATTKSPDTKQDSKHLPDNAAKPPENVPNAWKTVVKKPAATTKPTENVKNFEKKPIATTKPTKQSEAKNKEEIPSLPEEDFYVPNAQNTTIIPVTDEDEKLEKCITLSSQEICGYESCDFIVIKERKMGDYKVIPDAELGVVNQKQNVAIMNKYCVLYRSDIDAARYQQVRLFEPITFKETRDGKKWMFEVITQGSDVPQIIVYPSWIIEDHHFIADNGIIKLVEIRDNLENTKPSNEKVVYYSTTTIGNIQKLTLFEFHNLAYKLVRLENNYLDIQKEIITEHHLDFAIIDEKVYFINKYNHQIEDATDFPVLFTKNQNAFYWDIPDDGQRKMENIHKVIPLNKKYDDIDTAIEFDDKNWMIYTKNQKREIKKELFQRGYNIHGQVVELHKRKFWLQDNEDFFSYMEYPDTEPVWGDDTFPIEYKNDIEVTQKLFEFDFGKPVDLDALPKHRRMCLESLCGKTVWISTLNESKSFMYTFKSETETTEDSKQTKLSDETGALTLVLNTEPMGWHIRWAVKNLGITFLYPITFVTDRRYYVYHRTSPLGRWKTPNNVVLNLHTEAVVGHTYSLSPFMELALVDPFTRFYAREDKTIILTFKWNKTHKKTDKEFIIEFDHKNGLTLRQNERPQKMDLEDRTFVEMYLPCYTKQWSLSIWTLGMAAGKRDEQTKENFLLSTQSHFIGGRWVHEDPQKGDDWIDIEVTGLARSEVKNRNTLIIKKENQKIRKALEDAKILIKREKQEEILYKVPEYIEKVIPPYSHPLFDIPDYYNKTADIKFPEKLEAYQALEYDSFPPEFKQFVAARFGPTRKFTFSGTYVKKGLIDDKNEPKLVYVKEDLEYTNMSITVSRTIYHPWKDWHIHVWDQPNGEGNKVAALYNATNKKSLSGRYKTYPVNQTQIIRNHDSSVDIAFDQEFFYPRVWKFQGEIYDLDSIFKKKAKGLDQALRYMFVSTFHQFPTIDTNNVLREVWTNPYYKWVRFDERGETFWFLLVFNYAEDQHMRLNVYTLDKKKVLELRNEEENNMLGKYKLPDESEVFLYVGDVQLAYQKFVKQVDTIHKLRATKINEYTEMPLIPQKDTKSITAMAYESLVDKEINRKLGEKNLGNISHIKPAQKPPGQETQVVENKTTPINPQDILWRGIQTSRPGNKAKKNQKSNPSHNRFDGLPMDSQFQPQQIMQYLQQIMNHLQIQPV